MKHPTIKVPTLTLCITYEPPDPDDIHVIAITSAAQQVLALLSSSQRRHLYIAFENAAKDVWGIVVDPRAAPAQSQQPPASDPPPPPAASVTA